MSSYPRFETQEFRIGSLDYELILPINGTPGSINLLLVGGWSPKVGIIRKAPQDVYDPLQDWYECEADSFSLLGDEDVGADVFKLSRECLNRIVGWVNREKPGYFLVSPSTERKIPLYDRFARILEKRIGSSGYFYQRVENCYHFYRNSEKNG